MIQGTLGSQPARIVPRRTRKNLSKYITSAHEFFNYTMFLEAEIGERARKRIDLYRRSLADKDSPADDLRNRT